MCQYVYAYVMYYILLENTLDSFVQIKNIFKSFYTKYNLIEVHFRRNLEAVN